MEIKKLERMILKIITNNLLFTLVDSFNRTEIIVPVESLEVVLEEEEVDEAVETFKEEDVAGETFKAVVSNQDLDRIGSKITKIRIIITVLDNVASNLDLLILIMQEMLVMLIMLLVLVVLIILVMLVMRVMLPILIT
jgi:hypothetical protein